MICDFSHITQPLGFVDPKHPNKVYKVVKALYGLHQAPRAWYATLSAFLEQSEYRRGTINTTLFIKKDKKDIMLIKKLKKKARPVITHHKAWMKSVSMMTRLVGKKSMKKKWMQKESVSKQGRKAAKTAKSKPNAHKNQAFDDFDGLDAMDYIETEDAHNEKGVSIEDQVCTVKPDEGTDKPKVSTDKPDEGTDKPKVSTDKIDEGTAEPKNGNATPIATQIVFGDD
ncbi:putative ribonuclease H-like domain-containing protein [Tanacetum coccineum]